MNLRFDEKKLRELLFDFYKLTKMKIVIHDENFKKIAGVPDNDSEFCALMKQNDLSKEKCRLCDYDGFKLCGEKNEIYMYKCHAGLTEAVVPLKLNGANIGYIMFGQIIDKHDKKNKREEILKYAESMVGYSIESSFDKLLAKDKEQINSAAKIMQACACYLLVSELIIPNENDTLRIIETYIEKNITNDLSVDSICERFNISRNKLYHLFREYCSVSVAQYIRNKRIEHSKQLLKKGYSVAEAAGFSGFCDYNYFSRVFKKVTGVLPHTLKESCKK